MVAWHWCVRSVQLRGNGRASFEPIMPSAVDCASALRDMRASTRAEGNLGFGRPAMLTIDSIIRTTRQMTAFGERGTGGALDHLPARVQGQRGRRRSAVEQESVDDEPGWQWDDELKTYVRI